MTCAWFYALGLTSHVLCVILRNVSVTMAQFNNMRARPDLYAPLANRGAWQLKWELEDLSSALEPDQYKKSPKCSEEKRVERESFVVSAIARLE